MAQKVKGAELPIVAFKEQILDAVEASQVVIITAETGAGKSTQVPQYLLEAGYDLVVTQPRRLAARTVAARVAEEMGEKLGKTIGYRTAVDRLDSPATRCLFCTDGLALVCELLGQICTDGLALVRELLGQNKGRILVLDEVHEWNENIEVLVAWTKRLIDENPDFKVVLMSATLEAEKLSAFYGGAPIISVPGRAFPVEVCQRQRDLIDDVVKLVSEGRNVLVFQPGKEEIDETIFALRQLQVDAEILPLHGLLKPAEQAKCFKHYARPKVVVSTNVAQTSVTIDDIDAVVDSGMERRIELVDGVEGLYLKPISLADSAQRKGRAGRTKAGIYIDHCPTSDRQEFPKAEILRKRLDQTVLRLAIAGFDMAELEFFHQPAKSEIASAKQALVGLGCMTREGNVTKIGKLVNRLPVSVQYARMLVEANNRGVVDDILTIAAILEVGGITVAPPSRNRPNRPDWRKMVPSEKESDVMGQLAVYKLARTMNKDERFEKGISSRNYFRAKEEVRSSLAKAVRRFFDLGTTGNREDILKAVCAGMVDHLYEETYGGYRNGDEVTRDLGTASLVRGAKWLVGKPFDLQIKTRRGMMTLRLIEMATKVEPLWLAEVAPHLTETQTGLNPRYSEEQDCVVSTTKVVFNGRVVREETVADGYHPEAERVFAEWVATRDYWESYQEGHALSEVFRANTECSRRARDLNARAGEEVFRTYPHDKARVEFYLQGLAGARSVSEIADFQALVMPKIDEELAGLVLAENPDEIELCGGRFEVSYKNNNPRVELSKEFVQSGALQELPDEGVFLPSGRAVELAVSFGYYASDAVRSTSTKEFKAEVCKRLNRDLFDSWKKPQLPQPTDTPAIVEVEYGQCVATGQALVAFGVVQYDSYYAKWNTYWTCDRADAESLCARARKDFSEMRERVACDAFKKRIAEIRSGDLYGELPRELDNRLYKTQYGYSGGATTVAQIEALIAEAEAALEAATKRVLASREKKASKTTKSDEASKEEPKDFASQLAALKNKFNRR